MKLYLLLTLTWNWKKNEAFNINITLRQIELYVHFTNDPKAVKVLNYLNDVKKDIVFI